MSTEPITGSEWLAAWARYIGQRCTGFVAMVEGYDARLVELEHQADEDGIRPDEYWEVIRTRDEVLANLGPLLMAEIDLYRDVAALYAEHTVETDR